MYRFYRKHYARERNPLLNVSVYCGIAVKLAVAIARTELRRAIRALRGSESRRRPA
jgi:hypothetical protein